MPMLIQNARVIDPSQGLDKVIKPELRSASTRARIRNMSAGHALDLVRREILLK